MNSTVKNGPAGHGRSQQEGSQSTVGEPALEASNVSLRFGGTVALEDVSLRAASGKITGIIGPNGAGKSSLLNCINGLYRPQEGQIIFDGIELIGLPPHQIARLGIARTFQQIELSPDATVAESVLTGRHIAVDTNVIQELFWFGKAASEEDVHRRYVESLLADFDLAKYHGTAVSELPYGLQKLVDFARALAYEPTILLLDEPSSGMNRHEKEVVSDHIRRLTDEQNLTQVVIEHDMGFIRQVCDYLYVLNFGRVIASGPPEEALNDPEVVEAYLGPDLSYE